MTEIVHAPIYGVQAKWGNAAITRLHQVLNEEPKQTLVVPVRQFANMWAIDFWKNFNQSVWFTGVIGVFFAIEVVLARRKKQ